MDLLEELVEVEETHFQDLDPKVIDEMLGEINRTFIPPNYYDSLSIFFNSAFLRYSSLANTNTSSAYGEKDDIKRDSFIFMAREYFGKLTGIMAQAEQLLGSFSPTDVPLSRIKNDILFEEQGLEFLETQPREKHFPYQVLRRKMMEVAGNEEYERAQEIKEEIDVLTDS